MSTESLTYSYDHPAVCRIMYMAYESIPLASPASSLYTSFLFLHVESPTLHRIETPSVSSLQAHAQIAWPGMPFSFPPSPSTPIHIPGLSWSFTLTMKPHYLVAHRFSWPLVTFTPTETVHFPSRTSVTLVCKSVFINQTVSFLIFYSPTVPNA